MARYQMDDGAVVFTDKATDHWPEATRWNGNNHISVATGSQWHHQRLYRSRKGRYYLVRSSDYQGTSPGVEWLSNKEAARWLLANEHELPGDLESLADEISE